MAKAKQADAGMTIDRFKYDYRKTKVVGADGKLRTRTGNGDAVSTELSRALQEDGFTVEKIAKATKLDVKGSNPGQIRMNLGNMLRARVRKGEPMQIGNVLVKKLDQVCKPLASAKEAEKVIAARAKAKAAAPAKKPVAKKATKSTSRGKSPRSASRTKSGSSQTAGAAT